MKHFSLFLLSFAALTVAAADRIVWTGNEPISWNTEVYAGTQFETPDGTFTGLQKDDTIRVNIIPGLAEPQYVITRKAGAEWTWTDLTTVSVADSLMTYVVESDTVAEEIASRGLIFRGQGYDITRITIAAVTGDTVLIPDTTVTPIDTIVPLQPGEVRVLWTGSETLAWNEVAAQPAEVGALLGENDQILVTVSAKGTADWPKVLLRDTNSVSVGDDILLNDVTEFPYVAVFTLTSAHAAAMQGGFRLCGDGVTVTKMELKKYDPNGQPEPVDTTTIDLTGMYEKTVWTGTKAISWNAEEYAGDKFDTYSQQQDMLAGLAAGHIIAVAVTPDADAQYCLQYKAGNDWVWTDLSVQLVTLNDQLYLVYRVPDDDMAQLIADRGLVISGIRYTATKISLYADSEWGSALQDVDDAILNGQRYNLLGQPVGENYRGIVILNGRKVLLR